MLGAPEREFTLRDLAERLDRPYPSVHREISRAEDAGLVISSRTGRTNLIGANTESPYFEGLSDVLVGASGPPWVLGAALADVEGLEAAFLSVRVPLDSMRRPVDDIDLLVLGRPDRDRLDAVVAAAATTSVAKEVLDRRPARLPRHRRTRTHGA